MVYSAFRARETAVTATFSMLNAISLNIWSAALPNFSEADVDIPVATSYEDDVAPDVRAVGSEPACERLVPVLATTTLEAVLPEAEREKVESASLNRASAPSCAV